MDLAIGARSSLSAKAAGAVFRISVGVQIAGGGSGTMHGERMMLR